MSPAFIAIIATPPVVGIIWHSLLSSKARSTVRAAVNGVERAIESMGEGSERLKDCFARPTL